MMQYKQFLSMEGESMSEVEVYVVQVTSPDNKEVFEVYQTSAEHWRKKGYNVSDPIRTEVILA